MTQLFQQGHTSQTVLPNRDRVFKYMILQGPFSFKPHPSKQEGNCKGCCPLELNDKTIAKDTTCYGNKT